METERLILRRFEEADLDDLYTYLSDSKTLEYEPYLPMTRKKTEEELHRRINDPQMIAVQRKNDHRLIGNLWLGNTSETQKELGFVFHYLYWHHGYAKEACTAVIKDAFDHGVNIIMAQCDPENENSWRLLEALGMKRVQHLHANVYFFKDENGNPIWKDTYIYKLQKQ